MTDTVHFSPEAERRLLGTLLLDEMRIDPRPALRVFDFHEIHHRRIYSAMLELKDAGASVNVDTIDYALAGCEEVKEVGGLAYLTGLINAAGFMLDGDIKVVTDLSRERWAMQIASSIAVAGKNPEALAKVLSDAADTLSKRWGTHVDITKNLWNAAEIMDLVLPDSPWLLPGLILEGGLNLIAGEVAAGKTWLAIDLGIAAAAGEMAWGRKFANPTPTLYLGCDNNWSTLARRIKELVSGRGIPGPIGLSICDASLDLGSPEGISSLERLVTETGARMVVIDVLARYMRGVDENAAGEVAPVLTGLRAFANSHGVTLIILHHLNKSKGIVGQLLERIRGSIEFAGAVDTVMVLTVQGEGMDAKRMLRQKKNRDGEEADAMSFEILPGEREGLCLAFDTVAPDITITAEVKVRAFLGTHPESSKREILRGTKLGKAAGLGAIDQLVHSGAIDITKGARGADLCSLSSNDRSRPAFPP